MDIIAGIVIGRDGLFVCGFSFYYLPAVLSVLVTIYLQRVKKEQKQKKIKLNYGKKVIFI